MRSTDTHFIARARQVILALCISLSLSAQSDRDLLNAYMREDMTVWKAYVDSISNLHTFRSCPWAKKSQISNHTLAYEYGYCGYIVAEAKKEGNEALLPEAKRYVQQFKSQISNLKSQMPIGHYEMYMSAVYVFELRLHESIHPVKAMSLAKEAVKLAPNDPIVLSYYGTSLFYAPKPFGSKKDALTYFQKSVRLFRDAKWHDCWWRPATMMYIAQCHDKMGNTAEALRCTQELLKAYPDYEYIKRDYLPDLIRRTR